MVSLALAMVGVGLALLLCIMATLARRDLRMLSAQVAILNMRTAQIAEVVDLLDKDLRTVVKAEE